MPDISENTRIAYVAGEYPLVSLTFIQREIAALRDQGLDVITCSMRRTPASQHTGPAEKEAARTTFHVLDAVRTPARLLAAQKRLFTRSYRSALSLAWKTRAPGLKSLAYQLIYFVEATVLARHLEQQGVIHIHSHFTTGAATVAMLTSEMTGIPYSFTLHGPADLLRPYHWRLDEKTARAAFVATISHYARAQLMFFSDPTHWDRIRIVHCGVRPELYADAPGARADDEACELLFVGRLAPVKGLRVLLEALSDLDDLPGLRLTIVGDGPDRGALETLARPLGGQVRFTGHLSQAEVADAMKSADIVVLPSFAEGVPVVLMEAFASGKPVIATQVAGVGELVENGESGLIVAPGDAEGLKAAIRTLAADPAGRKAMGARGRGRVLAEFDIRTEAARLKRLFIEGPGEEIRPKTL